MVGESHRELIILKHMSKKRKQHIPIKQLEYTSTSNSMHTLVLVTAL